MTRPNDGIHAAASQTAPTDAPAPNALVSRRTAFRAAAGLLVLLGLLATSLFASRAAAEPRIVPPKKDPSGKLVVEFWHAMSGRQGQSVLELAASFNATHPNVRILPVYQGGYDSLSQKLIASCISSSNPPCAQMYESWTTRFLNRNLLTPIEDLADQEPPENRPNWDDLVSAFRENNTRVIDGKRRLVTLPFNKSVYMLFINEDRMHAVGYQEPPKDWAQWREYAEKMTIRNPDGTIKMYGFATRPLIESFTTNLMLTGINYQDESGKFTFAGQDGLEALEFLVDLTRGRNAVGYVEPEYLNTPFGNQRIAMYVASTASLPFNEAAVAGRFNWRAYPLPPRKQGQNGGSLSQGTNAGIFSNHPPEVQKAAWEFLRYITDTEQSVKWSTETGYLPVRYSALTHPKMLEYLKKSPSMANAFSIIDRCTYEPAYVYWESCRLVLNREVESALSGRKTVKKALEDALEKCTYIQQTE